jgi:hypothetical protein
VVRLSSEFIDVTRLGVSRRVLAMVLSACVGTVSLADPPNASTPEADAPLPTVTVEAQRQREELRRQIETYVSRVVVRPNDESLSRWDTPICPLVAGLPRAQGEFILRRLSAIVLEAQAPLDKSPDCHANFFVIVTSTPDLLLKKWRDRDPAMFNDARGVAGINRFLTTSRPVRVWYNADWGSASNGSPLFLVGGVGIQSPAAGVPATNHYDGGSKLAYSAVRHIESVIIVVDATRLNNAPIGPLTDYLGMVGLADVHLDADFGPAPTILQLFANSQNHVPVELSEWDKALLKALYTTEQSSVLQVSAMKSAVTKAIAP